ncbi:MAG TPA: plasmid pRiA4b ORF-3 family protein [Chloroflexia bacterium]|nr:plasmid pRiA4b ORF-3 family protein [Chloroflexia bacterium]
MRKDPDPLADLALIPPWSPDVLAARQAALHVALARLRDLLDHPPAKPPNWYTVSRDFWVGVPLAPGDLPVVLDLYGRVMTTGGSGTSYLQEALLRLIALTPTAATVPFWRTILDWARPREAFATQRRQYAASALARLARAGFPAAYTALHEAIHHANADVRAEALPYLAAAYHAAGRSLPPAVLEDVAALALHDPAFAPRFQARAVCRAADRALPLDYPGGVYTCKVKFQGAKRIYRTIEVQAEQTLDDLHLAIQEALCWDNDHLYSFYLTGKRDDSRYEIACMEQEFPTLGPQLLAAVLGLPPAEDAFAPPAPLLTSEAVIGALGLVPKHKFLYLFDYGDDHEFEIEVVSIAPQAAPGAYPRVVAAQGDAPAQYPTWDEDDEDY